jgi:hypothetical protein
MTDTSHRPGQAAAAGPPPTAAGPPTAWAGWVTFGGVMLIMIGLFQIVQGIVALVQDEYYLVTQTGLVVNMDYTAWGWTHLALGIIAGLTGIGLLAGNTLARVVGVVIAAVSALVNMLFIPAYPVWSLIVITLDVIVIFAIVVHGRELKAPSY